MTVPVDLTALMGGERLGSEPHPKDSSKKVVRFQQKVPIPSYLIALVVGALESRCVCVYACFAAINIFHTNCTCISPLHGAGATCIAH